MQNFELIYSSPLFCYYLSDCAYKLVPCVGAEDLESIEGKQGVLPSVLLDETLEEAENRIAHQFDDDGTLRNYGSHMNVEDGEWHFGLAL